MRPAAAVAALLAWTLLAVVSIAQYGTATPVERSFYLAPFALLLSGLVAFALLRPHLVAEGGFARRIADTLAAGAFAVVVAEFITELSVHPLDPAARIVSFALHAALLAGGVAAVAVTWRGRRAGDGPAVAAGVLAFAALALAPWTRGLAIPGVAVLQVVALALVARGAARGLLARLGRGAAGA